MKESKLVRHLATLSAVELNRFEKLVRSPYFNTHEDTLRLLLLLKKYHPRYGSARLEPRRLFARLYPQRSYNPNRLPLLSKNLLQLFYTFLKLEAEKQSPAEGLDPRHLYSMNERGLDHYLARELKQAEDKLRAYPYRDAEYYYHAFRLEEFRSEFVFARNSRSLELDLPAVGQQLDYFYLTKKLKLACAWLSRGNFMAASGEMALMEEIRAYCSGKDFREAPVVYLYYQVLCLLSEPQNEQAYYSLYERLPHFVETLPRDELLNFYILLINYCNQRYKQGDTAFLAQILALYKQMLAHDLVFEEGAQASVHYKNIATLGIKLGEYDWTKSFIHGYQERLPERYRAGVLHYNLAYLAYEQKNYRQAMRELMQVDFIDAFHRMNYYILLLKTYYENDEIEPLFSLCNTFGMYVRRNRQLSEGNRQAYLSLARMARKLARIKYGESNQTSALAAEIRQSELLVEREWLLQKAESLEKAG